jgi:hypothetical protein
MTYPPPRPNDFQGRLPAVAGPVARPGVPAVVNRAAGAMFAGAAVTATWAAVVDAQMLGLIGGQPAGVGDPQLAAYVGGFEFLQWIFVGLAGSAAWLWMARMAMTGRGWARVVSSAFFGVYFLAFVPAIIREAAIPRVTILSVSLDMAIVGVSLELLAGCAAIALLWQPASSQFFRASRQARATSGNP